MQKNELPFNHSDFGIFRCIASVNPLGILVSARTISHRNMLDNYLKKIDATALNIRVGSIVIKSEPSEPNDPVSIIPPNDLEGYAVLTEDELREIFKNGQVFTE